MIGYKLFRKRQDGTLGPLFINKRLKLVPDIVYEAECIPTKGFKVRPGWHICSKPEAPHLFKKNRYWYIVEFSNYEKLIRPEIQGGVWYIANNMKILKELPNE